MQKTKIMALALACILLTADVLSVIAADSLDIYTCFKLAESISPLKKQEALIQTSAELNLRNLSGNYLPEFTVSGRASYQSDVVTFPLSGAMFDIPEIPKDQYQASVNLKQVIFDAGITRNMKESEETRSNVSENQLRARIYNIKEVISQLYFSALILQENITIFKNSRGILQNQLNVIESRVHNGILLPSAAYGIEKELLNLDQRLVQAEYDRKTALALLSLWTGSEIDSHTRLAVPEFQPGDIRENGRPEIELFNSQGRLLESNKAISKSKQLPYLSVFAQGGYGSPNPFNFFDTEFSTFYIIGLQLNWKPFNWGNSKREIQSIEIQQQQVASEREEFERNISMGVQKDANELSKLRDLITGDRGIVELQKKIVDMNYSQLQNGVITATDYLTEFNSLTNSEINRKIHEILFAQVSIASRIRTGNIE